MSLSELCENWEDCEWIQSLSFPLKLCEVCEELNTWQSKKKQHFYTNWTLKGKFASNFQLFYPFNSMRLILHPDCEKHIFNQISSNTHLNRMGLISLYSRREIISYELKLVFWVFEFTSNSQLLQSKPLFDWLFTEIVFLIKTNQILI